MNALPTDLRLATRSLLKERYFTTAVVFTLSLGVTLCTLTMAVFSAYLLNDLPYPFAERLHFVRYGVAGQPQPRHMETLDWVSLNDLVEHQIAWDLDVFYLLGGEQAEAVPGAWVTPGFVEGLGIRPALGRGFDAGAYHTGGSNVALISHRLWKTRFHGRSRCGQQHLQRVRQRSRRRSGAIRHHRCPAGTLLAHQQLHRHPDAAAGRHVSLHGAAPARGDAQSRGRTDHRAGQHRHAGHAAGLDRERGVGA